MYNLSYKYYFIKLFQLITYFLTGPLLPDKVRYCERFLELVIDLEALLPTRRFFNTVMDDCHLVVRCQLSKLLDRPEGGLFGQVSYILFLNKEKCK